MPFFAYMTSPAGFNHYAWHFELFATEHVTADVAHEREWKLLDFSGRHIVYYIEVIHLWKAIRWVDIETHIIVEYNEMHEVEKMLLKGKEINSIRH